MDPQLLDDKHLLFTLSTNGGPERLDKAQIVVQSLVSAHRHVLVQGGTDARYLESGHLVYMLANNLLALAFDVNKLEPHGSAVPVIDGVMRSTLGLHGHFAVSKNGVLVYIPGSINGSRTVLAFLDANGKQQILPLPPGSYETPRISPNGKQLAVSTTEVSEQIVSVDDFSSSTTLRRLTFGGNNTAPVWSHDGVLVFQIRSRWKAGNIPSTG